VKVLDSIAADAVDDEPLAQVVDLASFRLRRAIAG
jgi:hypothetical protein